MKLFKVSQDLNKNYDVYLSFIVACKDEEAAKPFFSTD